MQRIFRSGLLCFLFCFFLWSLLLPFFTLPASAQGVYEAWVARYNGPENGNDYAFALAVDDSGKVYVTGSSSGSSGTDLDYATIKYSSSGDTLWVRKYNGPANGEDAALALAVDDSGNVYVTGGAAFFVCPPFDLCEFLGQDYVTIKYSPDGDTLWVRRYDGLADSDDHAYALAVDGSGNVYVTGYSPGSGTSYDYATIKYAPNGDTLWVRRYNGPGNDRDFANTLAVDGSGNVYVTGYSDSDTSFLTNADYATIKYSSCSAKPGDANGDGLVRLSDIIRIINHLYRGQPAPNPVCRGDADADGNVLLPDIIYLINFIFKSGPAPVKTGACCL